MDKIMLKISSMALCFFHLSSCKKEEIAKYYYMPINYNENRLSFTDFENEDLEIT